MVSVKARLERLIDGKPSKFRKPNVEPVEIDLSSTGSAASTMSSSSTNISDTPEEQQQHCPHNASSENDPYADVRQRLEELSRAEFLKFKMQNPHCAFDQVPDHVAYITYISYAFVIFVGQVRDFCAAIFGGRYVRRRDTGIPSDDSRYYAVLLKSWESFFTRRLYDRVQDVFCRPIASNPGAHITVLERVSDDGKKSMRVLGNLEDEDEWLRQEYQSGPFYTTSIDGKAARSCLNLGSYNYLGFADDWQETCGNDVKGSLQKFPVTSASSRNDYGTTVLHRELEKTIAAFLGKPDAIVLTMGFNTNATTIPALVGPGDLILSDELNHTSIVNGARASGAMIRTFRHNDVSHLESILREAILIGRPRTNRPWNKILVLVEGIYSMEGEFPDLPTIVTICKKYGAYVYLDEAHSIGAMGATGRGIAEHTGIDTADIDIMMGTFTKSFGAMGGYIAADAETIAYLRRVCAGSSYHNAMSPVVCQQILTAFHVRFIFVSRRIGSTLLIKSFNTAVLF
jgi:serine palmitoyltransferase